MEKMDVSGYAAMLGLFAEMILDDAVKKHKRQTLYREIDEALAHGDEAKFLDLTRELKLLN
ncbi:IDEAL domain-containing protein [Paenibacillus sp. HJGM_3]|uniref:IDEAL domain-containing protein n=1 Tax=Paenibacillus sp. HJGM_3 TaxID=3379816 RepID=UPI00385CCCE3